MESLEGGGFLVHRPFPTQSGAEVDPFLLLDEMGPVDYEPGKAVGAPDHPHRGFETVTYLLEGQMEHKDSRGNKGKLSPGDVQWMTAGAGVVHSEMPSAEFQKKGGKMHGFQLWVNLPRKDKMTKPRYQEIPGKGLPEVSENGVRVKVIAGEVFGKQAVIETHTPILYFHFTIEAGRQSEIQVPPSYNVFAYVVEGKGRFGESGDFVERANMILFKNDGSSIVAKAADDSKLNFLLIGGEPLHEPIARYGPFVMNTKQEIMQAFDDYQSGKMGSIDF
jgi:hypothetical protein